MSSSMPPKLPPIATVTTIDEVLAAIESIIGWSIGASSRLSYFAALYKQITIAVRTAVADGAFQDGPRMERFDVAFASRYFAALNGFFHPGQFPKPTHAWQVPFDAAQRPEPIILQHMMAGVTAHIELDLGIVAQTIAPDEQLPTLHEDFNRINAVLAGQVNGVVEGINELSPVLADLYGVLADNEINLISDALKSFRNSAWNFAAILAAIPGLAQPPTILARDLQVAQQGALVFKPPGPIATIANAIAARESRDIVKNIHVLDRIASTPAPIRTTM
jgi:hypothetical protein